MDMSYWEATSLSEFSNIIMKLEASLPCSQKPANCPYTKPDQFSPYHIILFH
jgi:hypothetical protein